MLNINRKHRRYISYSVPTHPPQEDRVQGWLPNYYPAGGNENPLSMPAVTPAQKPSGNTWFKYGVKVEFTRALQLFTWDWFQFTNPLIRKNNYRGIFDAKTAFTNFNGWHDNADPSKVVRKADWVNNQDTSYPNPYLMDGIICDGTLRTALESGVFLITRPGIDGIDVNAPLPSLQTVLDKGWYFRATIYGNPPYDWSQGHGEPVLIPYFLKEDTYYNKAYFTWWDKTYPPDPLKIGG